MNMSKSRRPVLPPHLVMLSIDDSKGRKDANLRVSAAETPNGFTGRTQPIIETIVDITSEKRAKEILRMQRMDATTANVTELKEHWTNVSKQTKIDIECKLFELAVASAGTGVSEISKKEFDAVRILAARTLFELPIPDKRDQMLRLEAAISPERRGIIDLTYVSIMAIVNLAKYGKQIGSNGSE